MARKSKRRKVSVAPTPAVAVAPEPDGGGGGESGGGGGESECEVSPAQGVARRPPSLECPAAACSCTASTAEVDAAFARFRKAPSYMGEMASRGPLNEPHIQRLLIADYLAHSRDAAHLPAKQASVPVRLCARGGACTCTF